MNILRASFRVSFLACPELLRDVQTTLLRFGLKREALTTAWRGWNVEVSLVATGSLANVRAVAVFLEDLAGQRLSRLDLSARPASAR